MENKFAINEVNQICPQLKFSEGHIVTAGMWSFIYFRNLGFKSKTTSLFESL